MSQLINIGGHGIGDCILSLQISYALKNKNIDHINLISTRSEVFNPINFIFGKQFQIEQIDENYANHNNIIENQDLLNELKLKYNSTDIIYNVPDLVFHHPLALNFEKYGLFMNAVRKQRLLPNGFEKKENIIYCGLCSVHEYHIYKDIPNLLRRLAEFLPNYSIYFPHLSKWSREVPNLGDFSGKFPDNVQIDYDPDFEKSLEILTKSKYGIFTDNGPSHIAYHLGIPRLILDPEYNNILWMCRWKDDMGECMPIQTPINDIVTIVSENIKYPQTTLIDRTLTQQIINSNNPSWEQILYFKY